MHTLLVDFHTGGHHLEYASQLLNELVRRGSEATMLGAEPSERYERLFDQEQINYLFEDGRDFPTELKQQPNKARQAAIRRVKEYVGSTYDVVHFLQIDDIIEECYRELHDWKSPAVIGSLNGAFFRGRSLAEVPLTLTADRLFHPAIADLLPVRSNKATLYRCLRDNVINHLFVPTELAKIALDRYMPDKDRELITTIPDPVKPWYDSLPEQANARDHLNLPSATPVLLCFGQMRSEKGIDVLLDALESYQGSEFTMLLAGSAADVSKENLKNVQNPVVSLDARLGFVKDAAIPQYFAAADGIVLPYRQSFGKLRPSGVFQKACASHLPVIAPEFGFFQQRLTEHNLGMTFEAGDPVSLASTLEIFVESMIKGIDGSAFEQYIRGQTYSQLAETTLSVYRTAIK